MLRSKHLAAGERSCTLGARLPQRSLGRYRSPGEAQYLHHAWCGAGYCFACADLGLTATISGQLADSFDIFGAKYLTISSTRTEPLSRAELLSLAASENYRRVSQLNGVTGTALVDQLDESADIQRGPDNFGERGANVTAAVLAATPSIFSVQGHELVWGRTFDEGHVERNDKVVVLSESVMRQLGYPIAPELRSIFTMSRTPSLVWCGRIPR